MTEDRAPTTTDRATVLIAIILSAAALYLAEEFFIPVALSLVLTAVLWPVVQRLERWKIPTAFGAALCILATVAVFVTAIVSFEPPVRRFANEIPKSIAAARPKIMAISASINKMLGSPSRRTSVPPVTAPKKPATPQTRDSTNRSSDSTRSTTNDSVGASAVDTAAQKRVTDSVATVADSAKTSKSKVPAERPASTGNSTGLDLSAISNGAPATVSYALGVASSLLGNFVEIILLAMFVLAGGHAWKNKLAKAVPAPSLQTNVLTTVGEMRAVVSRYVFMTALINVGQAIVIGLILKLLGYPSPLLWGLMTFALEFIPYFGGMVMVGLLFVVGLAGGRDLLPALYGPAGYLLVTTLQNNVLSPIVYGRGMRLNPTAILVGVMLWYMLWGVSGAFLAVPLLAAFNVLASRLPRLSGVNVFLSE